MSSRFLAGRWVHPIGLGAMELSFRGRPDEAEAIGHILLACEAGVGLIDTAEAYCATACEAGHNERLIARALARLPSGERPLVATKGGQFRTPDGSFQVRATPNYLRAACERSLRHLGVDVIDLYSLHWPDPQVPLAESVQALASLREEGLIRHIGLCNVSSEQLRTARLITDIASVQVPLSPDRPEHRALAVECARSGIALMAYWPLGGRHLAPELGTRHPRFAEIGRAYGVSPQRVALTWLLSLAPSVIPIPGSRRAETLLDSLAAPGLRLERAELDALSAAIPA